MAVPKNSRPRNVITLADLAPRHDVKGGSQRVFGSDPIEERDAMKKPGKKDLPPTKPTNVKGGRLY